MEEDATNRLTGPVHGAAVQAHIIHGGVHIHPSAAGDRAAEEDEVRLSSDVLEASRPAFESAGVALPDRLTVASLHAVQPRPTSRLADLVQALRWAVAAKPVLTGVGASDLEIGQLQVIYRREVGGWPKGGSCDALLVEAADVALTESRRAWPSGLGALARFVVGTAAALSAAPHDHPALVSWIEALGHQTADAQSYYLDRRHAPAWLLVDLGDEPARDLAPWPDHVMWTCFSREGPVTNQITRHVPAAPTEAGLLDALRDIVRTIPPAWPLWVDIAMPYALLDKGIEHWPVLRVDDEWESFSERCHPRLRWSLRRRDLALHRRCAERAIQSSWETMPEPLVDELLRDGPRLKSWVRTATSHAWLVGSHPLATGADPLRVLLREGCGFLIWFPTRGDDGRQEQIAEVVAKIPVRARRLAIPDVLPRVDLPPAVIWDDPRGRGEFALPPLVPAEHIQTHQL